jgi:hypothetical protein
MKGSNILQKYQQVEKKILGQQRTVVAKTPQI